MRGSSAQLFSPRQGTTSGGAAPPNVMAAETKTYRIGGLAITGAEAFLESFEPTFSAYLNQTVGEVYPGVGFIAVPLAFDDVWDAVSSASVDFLFLNPASASCMESEFGVSAILSRRNFRLGNELSSFGGVVITAANRSDITEVAHLQGKVVEGVSVSGLGAFQLQWGLLQDQGFNLMVDTEEVRFAYNQKKIVYDVISENVDVGFVRTDMVERMDAAGEVNISDVNFILVREDIAASGFPFPCSTDLVPEWPLQALPHVPSDLAKEVVRALMLINKTHEAAVSGGYSTWDVPLYYADLSALLVQVGMLDPEQGRCIQSENVYGAIVCPEGFFKIAESSFDSKCTELGRTCPDGYTCICRPCEPLPETEFSYSLNVSRQSVGTGNCQKMASCAEGVVAFSNLTVGVVDNLGPARETLGLNHSDTLEVHVITAGHQTSCYAVEHGSFPCAESTVHGGSGAPSLTTTHTGWDYEVTVSVETPGSTLLRVIVDGRDSEESPTLVGVVEPSCGDWVYESHVGSCSSNASRSVVFSFAEISRECKHFVDLPDNFYGLECPYAPWGSMAGIVAATMSSLIAAVALALTVWTVIYRKARPIVAAQWIFCVVFSTSITLMAVGAGSLVGPPSDFTCKAQPILYFMGSGTALSSLFLKMWRVQVVWKAGLKRIRIKNIVLFRYLAIFCSVDAALLMAMFIVHRPRASVASVTEQVSGVAVFVEHIACDYGELHLVTQALNVYHALIAAAGCVTSFKARKVGSQYMETYPIAFTMWSTTLIVGTLAIVSMSTSCDASCKILLNSLGTTVSATIALICIYGPKVVWVHFSQSAIHPDLSSNPGTQLRSQTYQDTKQKASGKPGEIGKLESSGKLGGFGKLRKSGAKFAMTRSSSPSLMDEPSVATS